MAGVDSSRTGMTRAASFQKCGELISIEEIIISREVRFSVKITKNTLPKDRSRRAMNLVLGEPPLEVLRGSIFTV